jgi:hypothetical protein
MSFGLKTSFGRYIKNKDVHLYGLKMSRYDIFKGKSPIEYFRLITSKPYNGELLKYDIGTTFYGEYLNDAGKIVRYVLNKKSLKVTTEELKK